ncbi:MAG: OsmC family protein [Geodermatophilaceae bacterium]|nr:OsmC family protein [Geodermatophilaceae bacterium]
MDAHTLREAQDPLKQRYRDDPDAARITLVADGSLAGAEVTCSVTTGQALAVATSSAREHTTGADRAEGGGVTEAGLHPGTGGTGSAACSGDMLLQALVACAGVTLRAVATSMGLDVTGATLHAEGDLDFRGTLGVDKQAPVGFSDIRLRVDLAAGSALSDDERATLLRLTERYCVVLQTLRRTPRTSATI